MVNVKHYVIKENKVGILWPPWVAGIARASIRKASIVRPGVFVRRTRHVCPPRRRSRRGSGRDGRRQGAGVATVRVGRVDYAEQDQLHDELPSLETDLAAMVDPGGKRVNRVGGHHKVCSI